MPKLDFAAIEAALKLPRYQKIQQKGICPACEIPERKVVQGRTRCLECLKTASKAMGKYRRKHPKQYNAYMRQYMRAYRARKARPQAPPDLLAQAKALEEQLHALRS